MDITTYTPQPLLKLPRLVRVVSVIFLLSLLSWATANRAAAQPPPPPPPCDFIAQDEASLRQAIDCVNVAATGAYTISITADIVYTQPMLTISNPAVTNLLIAGNGHLLDANGNGRVLTLNNVQNATLRDLTLAGGMTDVNSTAPNGGGLSFDCSDGLLCTWTLLNTVVRNNQASSGGGIDYFCSGGGGGALIVQDSVIDDNQASTTGGGIHYHTAEDSGLCSVTLRNTLLISNQAVDGGAIRISRPWVTIIDSTILNNSATDTGGGIMARISDGFITMTLLNSTVSGNLAGLGGGGLYVESPDQTFDIKLVNSTVSGNAVTSGAGGGLYLRESNDSLRIALLNSTVTENIASQGAGVHVFHQQSTSEMTGTLRLTNSIVANNLGGDCASEVAAGVVFSGQRVTSFGHNLDSDGTCLTVDVLQAGDIANGTANLGALVDNGGATQTHALLSGSQAIDAGDDVACAAEPVNGLDQRGVARPQGAHCDIGAYELTAECDYPDLVASDEPSLRQAIDCLNMAAAGDYTLTITADIAYTQRMFTLSNPAITNLLIAGDGHTLDAQGHGRVLRLTNVQNLTLRDLTLTGGQTHVTDEFQGGGGLSFDCSASVTGELVCTWTLLNTVVEGNQASSGGGITYICGYHGGGALIVQDSVIRDNQAASAGGGLFYASDEESGACSVTLRNTLMESNQAVDGGAIRILRPRVTIIDSTIRNNVASGLGGGLMARISDGFITITVLNSTISGNSAGLGGGGLYIASPDQTFDIKLINSTVSGNTVTNGAGGGLYLRESNDSLRITLLNSTVTQNAASQGAGAHIFHQDSTVDVTGTLRLTNSIVADNLGSDCAGEVAAGVVFSGQRVASFGHNLDSDGSCLTADVLQAGDIPSGNANLGPLADNGVPTFTHALLPGSDAIDAGDDAACTAEPVSGVDQRGITRPQGAHCDIGAYEAEVNSGANLLFVSSSSTAHAGNVPFRDEDILAYDFSTNTWLLVFDGSDVGMTKDVDAFSFLADGTLLLSFNGATTVPGLGAVDDSDIVRFTPTALGNDTAGSFAWYLHGADVGLTTDGEDIDLIDFSPDGHLVVSTIGNFAAPDATGQDEDLIELTEAAFGNPSSGTWRLFFDASSVGLANEDLNGLWIDPASGELYLTVKDSFAFDGQSIDSDDIFICTPTQTNASTTCAYRLFWDSDQHDYGSENLDSIHLGVLPSSFTTPVQVGTADQGADGAPSEDDDVDDLDVDEQNSHRSFLPIVVETLVEE